MEQLNIIPPRSGVSFLLKKGQRLKVVDLNGEQVSDFICYNLNPESTDESVYVEQKLYRLLQLRTI